MHLVDRRQIQRRRRSHCSQWLKPRLTFLRGFLGCEGRSFAVPDGERQVASAQQALRQAADDFAQNAGVLKGVEVMDCGLAGELQGRSHPHRGEERRASKDAHHLAKPAVGLPWGWRAHQLAKAPSSAPRRV